jgi:hypothetical protein
MRADVRAHAVHGLRAVAAVAITIPCVLAGSGLVDLVRGAPGPRVALTLPLRETGHADGVSFAALIIVWLLVFGLAAMLAPRTRLRVSTLAGIRAGLTVAMLVGVQAISLQLVRQATFGFQWAAALRSPSVYIAAVCALLATVACAPPRLSRTAPVSPDRGVADDPGKGSTEGRAARRSGLTSSL